MTSHYLLLQEIPCNAETNQNHQFLLPWRKLPASGADTGGDASPPHQTQKGADMTFDFNENHHHKQ